MNTSHNQKSKNKTKLSNQQSKMIKSKNGTEMN